MLFAMRFTTAFGMAMVAASCRATPMPVHIASNKAPDTAGLIRQGLDLAQGDAAPQGSTEIDIAGSWVNDTLFDGYGPLKPLKYNTPEL